MGMDVELSGDSVSASSSAAQRVTGWVELFVPHYPCSSCTGALTQFCERYPCLTVRVGHDDWRHWLRRLDAVWDKQNERHNQLSINARQLRDLDRDLGTVPLAYRNALRGILGDGIPDAGIARGDVASAAI